jgi:hypothetical protein
MHHVRDVTPRRPEPSGTGTGLAVIAALRNAAIGHHRITGATNIARATRQANRWEKVVSWSNTAR